MLVGAKLAMVSETSMFYKYQNFCLKSHFLTSSSKSQWIFQELTQPCENLQTYVGKGHSSLIFIPMVLQTQVLEGKAGGDSLFAFPIYSSGHATWVDLVTRLGLH